MGQSRNISWRPSLSVPAQIADPRMDIKHVGFCHYSTHDHGQRRCLEAGYMPGSSRQSSFLHVKNAILAF